MYQKFQKFLGRLLSAEKHIEVISNDTWLTRQQPRVRCAEFDEQKRLIFSCADTWDLIRDLQSCLSQKVLGHFTQVELLKTQHLKMVAEQ